MENNVTKPEERKPRQKGYYHVKLQFEGDDWEPAYWSGKEWIVSGLNVSENTGKIKDSFFIEIDERIITRSVEPTEELTHWCQGCREAGMIHCAHVDEPCIGMKMLPRWDAEKKWQELANRKKPVISKEEIEKEAKKFYPEKEGFTSSARSGFKSGACWALGK